jgi:non-homologous end joining protein Ku
LLLGVKKGGVDPATGKEVPTEEIVRGFEIDNFVEPDMGAGNAYALPQEALAKSVKSRRRSIRATHPRKPLRK